MKILLNDERGFSAMILYTTKARENWKQESAKMRKLVAEIPGNVLSYTGSGTIIRLLSMLDDYIDMEERNSRKT